MIMEELKLVSNDCRSRMNEILNESWKVFKWQFANKVFVKGIANETSFQFNFASVIRSIGNMYVLPGEIFYVDIETKWNNKKIDIVAPRVKPFMPHSGFNFCRVLLSNIFSARFCGRLFLLQ